MAELLNTFAFKMNSTTILMVSLAAFTCSQPPKFELPLVKSADISEDKQRELWKAVLRIKTENTDDVGSGIAIYKSDKTVYVLTANHIVSDSRKHLVETFDIKTGLQDKEFKVSEVSFTSPKCDFAIIQFKVANESKISVYPLPSPYQRPKQFPANALSIGCTYGAAPSILAEVISTKALVKKDNDVEGSFFWQTQQEPKIGRSGGPIFDKNANLIGICTAAKDGAGYYTHIDEIHAQLKDKSFDWLWAKPK